MHNEDYSCKEPTERKTYWGHLESIRNKPRRTQGFRVKASSVDAVVNKQGLRRDDAREQLKKEFQDSLVSSTRPARNDIKKRVLDIIILIVESHWRYSYREVISSECKKYYNHFQERRLQSSVESLKKLSGNHDVSQDITFGHNALSWYIHSLLHSPTEIRLDVVSAILACRVKFNFDSEYQLQALTDLLKIVNFNIDVTTIICETDILVPSGEISNKTTNHLDPFTEKLILERLALRVGRRKDLDLRIQKSLNTLIVKFGLDMTRELYSEHNFMSLYLYQSSPDELDFDFLNFLKSCGLCIDASINSQKEAVASLINVCILEEEHELILSLCEATGISPEILLTIDYDIKDEMVALGVCFSNSVESELINDKSSSKSRGQEVVQSKEIIENSMLINYRASTVAKYSSLENGVKKESSEGTSSNKDVNKANISDSKELLRPTPRRRTRVSSFSFG